MAEKIFDYKNFQRSIRIPQKNWIMKNFSKDIYVLTQDFPIYNSLQIYLSNLTEENYRKKIPKHWWEWGITTYVCKQIHKIHTKSKCHCIQNYFVILKIFVFYIIQFSNSLYNSIFFPRVIITK